MDQVSSLKASISTHTHTHRQSHDESSKEIYTGGKNEYDMYENESLNVIYIERNTDKDTVEICGSVSSYIYVNVCKGYHPLCY